MNMIRKIHSFWKWLPYPVQWIIGMLGLASFGVPFILLMQHMTARVASVLPDSPAMFFIALPVGGISAILIVVAAALLLIVVLLSIASFAVMAYRSCLLLLRRLKFIR